MTETDISTTPVSPRHRSSRWFPLLLIILALADLRTEFRLLSDHFTVTALLYAIRHHLLAVAVLLGSVSLLRRYR